MRHSESRDRLLNAVSWCWLVLGLAFGVYLLLPLRHPDASGHTAHAYTSEQRELTPVSFRQEPVRTHATRKIEDISVGDRVLAFNPLLSPEEHLAPDPNAGEWRQIDLAITKADGYRLDITLLRPIDWLEAQEARLGGTILLDIPEMNAYGEAQVLSISQCPPIRPGDGRVVVGKFRHTSGDIIDLGVGGVSEPIGTTADHPFWSETREEFVEAGDLKIGELLLSVTGEAVPVTSLSRRGPPEPVYNLQVHSEHVYFVSSEGVLVHNYDPPTAPKEALSRGAYLRQKYAHLSPAQRAERIDQLSYANYIRRLDEAIGDQQFVYRYLTEDGLATSFKYNSVRGYTTTEFTSSSATVASRSQILADWGNPTLGPSSAVKYGVAIPVSELKGYRVARPFGGKGTVGWEFRTNSYPTAGSGGWIQFDISSVPLDKVHIFTLH